VNYQLGPRMLYGPRAGRIAKPPYKGDGPATPSVGTLLFTNNETNMVRVYGPGNISRKPYVKDAFHRFIVDGEPCISPEQMGTKPALHYRLEAVPRGGPAVLNLRFSDQGPHQEPLADVDEIVARRRKEADDFYATIHPAAASEDDRRVQRQALAGLL